MGFQAIPALDVNRHLIGVPGGRAALATPALVVELDVLKRNIALMARLCADAVIALRPHAKSHKCAAIAKLRPPTSGAARPPNTKLVPAWL